MGQRSDFSEADRFLGLTVIDGLSLKCCAKSRLDTAPLTTPLFSLVTATTSWQLSHSQNVAWPELCLSWFMVSLGAKEIMPFTSER